MNIQEKLIKSIKEELKEKGNVVEYFNLMHALLLLNVKLSNDDDIKELCSINNMCSIACLLVGLDDGSEEDYSSCKSMCESILKEIRTT